VVIAFLLAVAFTKDMLDQIYVCTTNGLLLWYKDYLSGQLDKGISLLNRTINEWVIPSLALQNSAQIQGKTLKWSCDNEILVVAVYSAHVTMPFPVERVLEATRLAFIDTFAQKMDAIVAGTSDTFDWLSVGSCASFSRIFEEVIAGFAKMGIMNQKDKIPRAFKDSIKFAATAEGAKTIVESKTDEMGNDKMVMQVLQKSSLKQPRAFQPKKGKESGKDKKKKDGRSWDASGAAIASSGGGSLDFSNSDLSKEDIKVDSELLKGSGFVQGTDGVVTAIDLEAKVKPQSTKSSVFSLFASLTTGKSLTERDLEGPITKVKEHLVGKNVAAPVALHLCKAVQKALLGTKLSTLTSIDSVIKKELEKSLSRILTPSSSTDILHQISEKRKSKEPYSICFVGVNGVGKSTNLSKICFWLLQNGLSVLIAACDTFRSGAVEQLKVHERNLNALNQDVKSRVQLFDRGYGKDPAGIAKEAISFGNQEYDLNASEDGRI
jgi:signal recognition particle receptor subunit alpha